MASLTHPIVTGRPAFTCRASTNRPSASNKISAAPLRSFRPAFLPSSALDGESFGSFLRSSPKVARRGGPVRYKEAKVDEEVKDWRIKEMCKVAHRYYAELWSNGSKTAAEEILDENVSLKDELWGSHPFVGRVTLTKQVLHFRTLYPDLVMEIDDIGVYGTQDLAIRWSARATNLGGAHPTHHYTHFAGVSSIHFTDDHKRIAEVVTYRQPTSEEMTNKCDMDWNKSNNGSRSTTEIQLVPLHVSTANYDYLPGLKKDKKGD